MTPPLHHSIKLYTPDYNPSHPTQNSFIDTQHTSPSYNSSGQKFYKLPIQTLAISKTPSSSNKLDNFFQLDKKIVVSNALCEKLLECVQCPWLVLLIRRLDVNRLHGGGVAVRLATDGH